MSIHLSKEINKLKKLMSEECSLVEESMKQAIYSFTNHDVEIANDVIKQDKTIDNLEIELEEECLKILALHQPVAGDLRYVIACLKMNNDLERIGDLSAHIAKNTKVISATNEFAEFEKKCLRTMMEKSQKMLKDSLDALFDMNIDLAKMVCNADDEVDDLNDKNYKRITKQITNDPNNTEYYMSLLGVSRSIERIADYATNIAEDIIYMINGDIVRHK